VNNKKNLSKIEIKGWQSWSPAYPTKIKIPIRNFSPFAKADSAYLTKIKIKLKPAPTGWCSWYAFGQNINSNIIINQAEWIAKNKNLLPLDYVIIDEGWTSRGDWLKPNLSKFPQGMKILAQKIKKLGLKPGLWISPFLVSSNSIFAQKHADWLIKNKDGSFLDGNKLIPIDNLLPRKNWVLNLGLKDVQDYLVNVIDTLINDWGYQLLKLDFLYAQHFNPDFSDAEFPDKLLADFLKRIKKTYPRVYFIACGCPLAPALGSTDAMRISEDIVIPYLRNIPILNSFIHKKTLGQLEQNLKLRKETKKFWQLDPDVFICDRSYGLNESQIYRLLNLIKEADGLKFLGDDLVNLDTKLIKKYILKLFS